LITINGCQGQKGVFWVSANIDPNAVGAVLVVAVIGIIGFYIWQDIKKRPSYHSSYPASREPSGILCENCGASTYQTGDGRLECGHCGHTAYITSPTVNNEPQIDPFTKGYEEEMGRLEALREAKERREQEATWKRDHPIYRYDPPPEIDFRNPVSDFLDDVDAARKKRKKNNYW
jgi:hypothetical protein